MAKESLRQKLHYAKLGILASLPEAIAFCNSIVVYADTTETNATKGANVTKKVQKTSNSIWGILKLVSMSLLVVVLAVCGLILVIGTQKMKETIKEHFYSIAFGCLILFLAKDIAEYIEEAFG